MSPLQAGISLTTGAALLVQGHTHLYVVKSYSQSAALILFDLAFDRSDHFLLFETLASLLGNLSAGFRPTSLATFSHSLG